MCSCSWQVRGPDVGRGVRAVACALLVLRRARRLDARGAQRGPPRVRHVALRRARAHHRAHDACHARRARALVRAPVRALEPRVHHRAQQGILLQYYTLQYIPVYA